MESLNQLWLKIELLHVLGFFLLIVKAYSLVIVTLKSNEKIHEDMVESLVRSPLAYFDTTPSGQVTNRFSSDLAVLDNGLLYALINLL